MLVLATFLLIAGAQSGPVHPNLTGIIEPFLTASEPETPAFCVPASNTERERISDVDARKGRAWMCKLFCGTPVGERLGFLIERRWRRRVLFIDLNDDGRFANDERHALVPERDLLVRLPAKEGATVAYPVAIRVAPAEWKQQATRKQRVLLHSVLAFYLGTVTVDGRVHRVEYPPDWETLAPSIRGGWMGFDVNGDGTFGRGTLSPEKAFADSDDTVFRIGDRYVSTLGIDPVTRVVQLREHQPSDYRRIELRQGNVVSDFTFTDLSGASRRLSEMPGRLTLLAIWSSWCGPAVDELQNVERAYRTLGPQGLAVIGLPDDSDLEKMRVVIAGHGVTWPNAKPESVRQLLKERLEIWSNPVFIVLDAERRIVMVSTEDVKSALRGPALVKTLRRLLR